MGEYTPTSTYVPTDDEVETAFHEFASWLETKYPGECEHAPEFADWREAMHGFRRWLAAHDAEVAAKAISDAAEWLDNHFQSLPRWNATWQEGSRSREYERGSVEATCDVRDHLRARATEYRKAVESE